MYILRQYLRRGFGGLPAFRRLIGKPILFDLHMQDVVFATGHVDRNPGAIKFRSSVTPVSILRNEAVKLEKSDLRELRVGLLKMIQAGAAPCLEDLLPEFAPPSIQDLEQCPEEFGMQARGTDPDSTSIPVCQLQRILFKDS